MRHRGSLLARAHVMAENGKRRLMIASLRYLTLRDDRWSVVFDERLIHVDWLAERAL